MKVLKSISVALLAYCAASLAQRPLPDATALEALALKPGARIVLEDEVGSMTSADARMIATALIVQDPGDVQKQLRGVRFDLESDAATDHVYLDEGQLAVLQRELGWIEDSLGSPRPARVAPHHVEGTESCWIASPYVRILCPDYYTGPEKAVFRAGALCGPLFEFPGRKPADLLTLIDAARERLGRE